jgi:phosphohistidine phosphatase
MLTLSLLRHAKSNWDDIDLDDFDRPLSKRGANAAPEMGRAIRELNLKPDLVLCSSAVRTRATVALVMLELGPPPPEVRYEEGLYLATPSAMLGYIRKIEKKVRNLLIVGHNPGTHALALELTGAAKREDMAELATKFPTAALASMTFDLDNWRDVKAGLGHLVVFLTPRNRS